MEGVKNVYHFQQDVLNFLSFFSSNMKLKKKILCDKLTQYVDVHPAECVNNP